jgi:hypothetical protein
MSRSRERAAGFAGELCVRAKARPLESPQKLRIKMKTKTNLHIGALLLAAVVTGVAQPVITSQPQSQTNVVGSMVTLSVAATGVPPLFYQWRRSTANVAGATNATLVITNLQSANAGNYTVVVTNVEGSVTSTIAFVRLILPPVITTQPASQTAEPGSTATFRVVATGTSPLSYQWRSKVMSLPAETNINLVVSNVQFTSAADFTVTITNLAGSVTSHVATLAVVPGFAKITAGHIVNDAAHSVSGAWGDYDNDDFLDLFVTNADGQTNFFYRNNGNGGFTRITNGAPVSGGASWRGCAWGDYDNDGHVDLFATSSDADGFPSRNVLYRNNGDGTFSEMTTNNVGSIAAGSGGSEGCAWGDYDNDGFLDMFVARYGDDYLYHADGDGTFSEVTDTPLVVDGRDGYGLGWADFDNDGRLDLFVPNSSGQSNLLYRNLGGGEFEKVVGTVPANEGGNSYGAAWGDYDNDGFADLFVANGYVSAAKRDFLYRNNRDGTFTKITNGVVATDSGSSTQCMWGDFDNDGNLDLFVCNGNGPNFLYWNRGDGTFIPVSSGSIATESGTSIGCSWGDFDNDGFLDLFVARGAHSSQNNLLYRNTGNANGWIKVRCIGTASNRSAIGAKVRIRTVADDASRWQMREITSGTGWGGGGLVVHFGLGKVTNIATVRIEWPSGTVQELHNVEANRFLTITEPARLSALRSSPNSPFQMQLTCWRGFDFAVETSSNLIDWMPWTTVTTTNRLTRIDGPAGMIEVQQFYRAVSR